ncbi:hypothetical protein B1A99_03180 [Cohnella sp. CIP 111063]|uniref:glycosyltransferase family 4 protein n=1 Tax=unclassified Cohnella TaxID=2636738 RepID=UPI000B9CDFD6|nr:MULTISPECIES: glycosyltransferase family 4 protein [unclassified Cohnella]OXS61634.1 hypothetical protein B1A99_03180 [Cohnella sp. CIP 111063]PRX74052.1 glycosyltransferase involved in cell wall biosynthesis [Cohnella sp. SGD-V74]
MEKPTAIWITNIPVPYRYRLYESFCNNERFDGRIWFDSLSYGESWATQLNEKVSYEILGGRTLNNETGKTPISFNLIRRLREQSPDIVVLTDFSPLWIFQTLFYMATVSKKIKLVSMTDENRDFFSKMSFKWLRLLFRKIVLQNSQLCICCSQRSSDHIQAISKSIKGKTIVSYLTPEASYYGDENTRNPGKEIHILTVCRLVELKRVDRIIKAVALLHVRASHLRWKLSIAGDGEEVDKLQQLAKEVGIENNIMFLGRVIGKKLRDVYRQSDIFMLTSYKEPWGVVVHEAMLSGLVPIVTRAVGASEMVEKAGGIVVEDQIAEDTLIARLADALEDLILDSAKLRDLQIKIARDASQVTIDHEVAACISAI